MIQTQQAGRIDTERERAGERGGEKRDKEKKKKRETKSQGGREGERKRKTASDSQLPTLRAWAFISDMGRT